MPRLGAASAELMRRLNDALADIDMDDADHARICRKFLGKSVLPELKSQEPSITLPSRLSDDAQALSVQIVTELRHSGVGVVGDLDDLLPSVTLAESQPPTDGQIAAAALVAMAALVEQNAQLARKRPTSRQ